ncbi:hypothetical protein ES706_04094 [subsurface metagenome]
MEDYQLISILKVIENKYLDIIKRARELSFINFLKLNDDEIVFFSKFPTKEKIIFLPKKRDSFYTYSLEKEQCFELNHYELRKDIVFNLSNHTKFIEKLPNYGFFNCYYRGNRFKLFEFRKLTKNFIILVKCPRYLFRILKKEPYVKLQFGKLTEIIFPQEELGILYKLNNVDQIDTLKSWPQNGKVGLFLYSINEEKCLPLFDSTIYQYRFLIQALKDVIFPKNQIASDLKDLLKNDSISLSNQTDFNEIIQDNNQFNLNSSQKEILKNLFKGERFVLFDSPAGTGKTTLILLFGWFCSQILTRKILFLSHDHAVMNNLELNFNQYKPKHLSCRIGNPKKAKDSKLHFEQKNQFFWESCCSDVDKNIQKYENMDVKMAELLKEWLSFISEDSGKNLFKKLAFNSARIIFGTINGLEYYKKREILDYFLPFDYVLIDESSKIQFPMLLNVALFSKNWIVSGDNYSLQPWFDYYAEKPEDIEPLYFSIQKNFPFLNKNHKIELKKIYNRHPLIVELLIKTIYKDEIESYEYEKNQIFDIKEETQFGKLTVSLGPFIFIDTSLLQINSVHSEKYLDRYSNENEIKVIQDILKVICNQKYWNSEYIELNKKPTIWITSLFNSQVEKIKETLSNSEFQNFIADNFKNDTEERTTIQIKISNVTEFVSQEADIVLWSLSYAPKKWLNKRRKSDLRLHPQFRKYNHLYFIPTHVKSKLIIIGWLDVFKNISQELNSLIPKYSKRKEIIQRDLIRRLETLYQSILKSGDIKIVRIKPEK